VRGACENGLSGDYVCLRAETRSFESGDSFRLRVETLFV